MDHDAKERMSDKTDDVVAANEPRTEEHDPTVSPGKANQSFDIKTHEAQSASESPATLEPGNESMSTTQPLTRRLVGWKWTLLVISMLATVFLYAMDNTVLANSRPPIIKDLGEIEKLPWLTVAYAFGACCVSAIW